MRSDYAQRTKEGRGWRQERDCAERREELVHEHMESENQHRFDVSLGTFDHPRYELVPRGRCSTAPRR